MADKQNPDGIAEQISRSEQFLKKNLNLVLGVIVGIIVVISAILYFQNSQAKSAAVAQEEVFLPQLYFDRDSLDRAIFGDGNALGFEAIIDDYSGSDAANLSHFYMGVIELKKGNHEAAISHLKEFSSSDLLVQARAYSLIGDAYVGQGNNIAAVDYFDKAAAYKPNEKFSPLYLEKAAITYEEIEDFDAALNRYKQIVEKYPNSDQALTAKKQKARLEQKAS